MTDQRDDPSEIDEITDNGEEGESKEDNTLEKRYSASSREAKRLASENKKLTEERAIDTESIRVMKDASRLSTLDPDIATKIAKRLHDEGLYTTDDYHNALELYIKKPDTSRVDPDKIREQVKADIARENQEKELKTLLKDAGSTVQTEFEDEYGDLNLPPQKAKKIIEGIIARNRTPIENAKALAGIANSGAQK